MTILPIVGRELTVASRRAATYWLRFWAAAGALVIFPVAFLDSSNSITGMGHEMFLWLAGFMLLFSLLAGGFLTADSLSAEKREGTLGLLFLTDLKGYDVVLGKLAAHSLQAVFGLLAVFPVLALPLLTGGLSGGECWRTILVLTVTMFLSLAIGMLVSAASHDGRRAMVGTFATMALLVTLPPLLWQVQDLALGFGFLDFLLWPNPVFVFRKGLDTSYLKGSGPWEFWAALAALFSLAGACILAAGILLPRWWQKSAGTDLNTEPPRFEFLAEARQWRRPALGHNEPYFWLALGNRAGQVAMIRMFALFGPLWAASLVFLLDLRSNFPVAVFLAFGLHFAVKILIARESGRRFHQDRQSGALEFLLVTPLSVRDIVAGQRKGLWRQFRGALWLISLANAITLVVYLMGIIDEDVPGGLQAVTALLVFLGGTVLLWLDAGALIWLGMWRGLKAKTYPRSVMANLGQVLLPPWLVLAVFAFIEFSADRSLAIILLVFWIGLGVAVDLSAVALADRNLMQSFRSVVSEGLN
jgi:ABC-type transport system involved in cytochrome c biogenesis permease component